MPLPKSVLRWSLEAADWQDAYDTIRARIEGRIEEEILAMKAALIVPVIQWPAEAEEG